MAAEEERVANSGEWKEIQKNTFTRWANDRLKASNLKIEDLQSDLSNGVRLIALVEALSGEKFAVRYNRCPLSRTQKLENVTLCLTFLEREQGVRIINIDSADIVDGNQKLLLGLIWTLILHYSISTADWSGQQGTDREDELSGLSPKQRLLAWIRQRVTEIPIFNLTSDWNDGKALGALVSAMVPGQCSDWRTWDEEAGVENTRRAMDVAAGWLNVAQLITPAEMCDPSVDEQSMMTYLSQFPSATLGNPDDIKEVEDGSTKVTNDDVHNAGLVRAYGDGLSVGHVGHPAKFVVANSTAPSQVLKVSLDGPAEVTLEQSDVEDGREFTYVVPVQGIYHVSIMYAAAVHIPGSPFRASFSEVTHSYKVNVHTGDVRGAGTDANVYIVLVGLVGETDQIPLKSSATHLNKFERDQVDEFVVEAENIGELQKIRIGHDNALGFGAWFLERVEIYSTFLRRTWKFPHGRWLAKDQDDGLLEHELLPGDTDSTSDIGDTETDETDLNPATF